MLKGERTQYKFKKKLTKLANRSGIRVKEEEKKGMLRSLA